DMMPASTITAPSRIVRLIASSEAMGPSYPAPGGGGCIGGLRPPFFRFKNADAERRLWRAARGRVGCQLQLAEITPPGSSLREEPPSPFRGGTPVRSYARVAPRDGGRASGCARRDDRGSAFLPIRKECARRCRRRKPPARRAPPAGDDRSR